MVLQEKNKYIKSRI